MSLKPLQRGCYPSLVRYVLMFIPTVPITQNISFYYGMHIRLGRSLRVYHPVSKQNPLSHQLCQLVLYLGSVVMTC
jgi:hypothetical protein